MTTERDYCTRFRVADVINELGGIAETARFLGVSVTAVGQFKRRDCFPPARALQLADHFGLSPEFFHDPWIDVARGEVPRGTSEDELAELKKRSVGDD